MFILFLRARFLKTQGSWSSYYYYNATPRNFSECSSKGETECKRVLESIFNKPFNKIRPKWLANPITGNNHLELDLYNEELGLACEYQGKQHYVFTPFFHKSKEHFYNQKYRDELKRRMCKDNGLILIEVPYTVNLNNIEKYIKQQLSIINLKP